MLVVTVTVSSPCSIRSHPAPCSDALRADRGMHSLSLQGAPIFRGKEPGETDRTLARHRQLSE